MRLLKPSRCELCNVDVPRFGEDHYFSKSHNNKRFPPQALPSVVTPNSPATGGSLPKPSPQPVDALGRAPRSDRPDVSPKSPGPLLAEHQDIKLDPNAVRELLW